MPKSKDKKPNYIKWSTEDLITAIKNRTLQDVPMQQKKSVYIERLKEIDRNPPGVFRFMDLPAEMRNNVYEELLPDDVGSSRRVVHHPILRTCKAIYKEAASMFYLDSHVRISIKKGMVSFPHRKNKHAAALRDMFFEHRFGGSKLRNLRHGQNITVAIAYDGGMRASGDDGMWRQREIIASGRCFLAVVRTFAASRSSSETAGATRTLHVAFDLTVNINTIWLSTIIVKMQYLRDSKYASWSKEELIAAITTRTHEDIDPKQKRRTCIRRLNKLDREPPGVFRLLDLPAELRIHIYEAIFEEKDDTGRGTCSALLRTSKPIYKEAVPGRHEGSHVHLTILASRDGNARVRYGAEIKSPETNTRFRTRAPVKPPETELPTSEALLRLRLIHNFTVTIDFSGRMRAKEFVANGEGQVCEFWTGMMRTCEDLRSLKIVWRDDRKRGGPYREQLLRLVEPLWELGREVGLVWEGLGRRMLWFVPRGVEG
ncbi:hypothetical protein M409DRAFT_48921 [Zasmidium cellare ATCC 36951]|uniref:Uncharacterized protein n=1 Tax=Zasmidium cellare ATCC 36951 TaxID=1080233 RepID=A0A6A6D6S8_ZASCE|nr:uncharacterized protein M409DRAFT_48921 [Zasmidium cellare ATCC 36951]KAF2174030.1 hypothetical protein M409DRAFT_48921 [Zasmidium cellare ATCC 36951]